MSPCQTILAFGRFRKIQRWPRTDPEDERSEHELFMNRLKSLSLSGDTTEKLSVSASDTDASHVGILASKTSPAHKLRRGVSARKVLVPEGCALSPFMTRRMLIDAAHEEETRVVVMDGNRVVDYDAEIASKRPLKGNIHSRKSNSAWSRLYRRHSSNTAVTGTAFSRSMRYIRITTKSGSRP